MKFKDFFHYDKSPLRRATFFLWGTFFVLTIGSGFVLDLWGFIDGFINAQDCPPDCRIELIQKRYETAWVKYFWSGAFATMIGNFLFMVYAKRD